MSAPTCYILAGGVRVDFAHFADCVCTSGACCFNPCKDVAVDTSLTEIQVVYKGVARRYVLDERTKQWGEIEWVLFTHAAYGSVSLCRLEGFFGGCVVDTTVEAALAEVKLA